MQKKAIISSSVLFLFLASIGAGVVRAQEIADSSAPLDYAGGVVLDTDLDGLTDQGEEQKYKTDPNTPDTDQDGFFDGAEVMVGTDPLDVGSPGVVSGGLQNEQPDAAGAVGDNAVPEKSLPDDVVASEVSREIPWAWYVSRMSGLIGIVLLYVSIFLGLIIRIPFLQKISRPLIRSNAHCWISLQAFLFAFFHGSALMLDKFFKFSVFDVFIPFAFKSSLPALDDSLVALGVIGFYLMALLLVTSYSRKHISYNLWRATHFSNIALYAFVTVHALYLGTDLKTGSLREIFIALNEVLIGLMIFNMIVRIRSAIKMRRIQKESSQKIFQPVS